MGYNALLDNTEDRLIHNGPPVPIRTQPVHLP